jgi:subtilisin family serine protease
VDAVPASRFTAANLDGRSVVLLNDAALSTPAADLLTKFVGQGGGLFMVLGGRTPASGAWPLMPGSLTGPVDRTGFRGGTFGSPDYSHPIFEQFKDPRAGSFANMRFFRYRRLAVAPDDRVLARFDDGAAAIVERRAGSGRVVAFTSTLDGDWNDFPRHAMFLPLLHETIKYLAQYGDLEEWHTVGRMLDITAPVASMVRQGQASILPGAGRSGVVVSPGGQQATLGGEGAPAVELSEQGFYSVRLPGTGDRRPFTVAVNLDPAESDLTELPPTDISSAVGTASAAAAGQSFDRPVPTPVDLEKRQSLWWFLLVAGLSLLLVEAVLSNMQSKKLGLKT